jgi:hypothetical protein
VRRLSRKESARASDIEAPAGHLEAAAEVSGDLIEAQSTAGCPPSRRTRDEEGAAEPVGFILDVGVPLATSAPVEGGGREVEQEGVGQLMSKVAGLSGASMGVVVDDYAGGYGTDGALGVGLTAPWARTTEVSPVLSPGPYRFGIRA